MSSLIHFHRFLIAAAIAFCIFFAGWELLEFARAGGSSRLVLGIAFVVAAIGLAWYLKNLRRFLNLPKR